MITYHDFDMHVFKLSSPKPDTHIHKVVKERNFRFMQKTFFSERNAKLINPSSWRFWRSLDKYTTSWAFISARQIQGKGGLSFECCLDCWITYLVLTKDLPYLVIDPSIFDANKSFTTCTVNEALANATTLLEGLTLLVETYYVFDMKYPKDAKDVFNFIECCLLKMKAVKPSRCVSTALIKLQTTPADVF